MSVEEEALARQKDDVLIGRILDGRYLIGERIARGGMASVFLATDRRLDRTVAVKIMHDGLGDETEFLERFNREAKAAAKLNHRGVVSVFDQGTDRDVTYLVMEYVPGKTLRDIMRAEAPMTPERSLGVLADVLVALSAAHAAGIVHRDIKPENVLITPDGDVKVADFGLARAVSTATTATGGALIGTISYIAPEIVLNEGADARSDVYACGAMLFEMLTGSKPHGGDTPIQIAYKHVHEDVSMPSEAKPGLPPYVDALVARATVRDRSQRPADARALLQMVRRVQRALEQGLDDEARLTADLMPKPVDPDEELTEQVTLPAEPAADTEAEAMFPLAAPALGEQTVQWTTGTPPPPRGLVPAMTPKDYREDRDGLEASQRGRMLLIGAISVAVFLGFLGWYLGVGRYDDAPRVVGMSESSAAEQAESGGFVLKVSDRAYSESAPLGTVISADPEAGDNILPGATIHVIISKGKERYAVPKLRGLQPSDAVRELRQAHLEVGDVTEEYSETVAKGLVRGVKNVNSGDLLRRDTRVDFVVSKGREPIFVRSYRGRQRTDAVGGLRAAGFNVAVRLAFSDTVSEGRVISQYPSGGTRYRGDTITITVSKGPDIVTVPDVVGKSMDSATSKLEGAGLKVKRTGNRNGNATVGGQKPSSGTDVKRGSTVTIGGEQEPNPGPAAP